MTPTSSRRRPTHRWRLVGDVLDRLTQRIEFDQSCWLWIGRLNITGYGRFWDKNSQRSLMAHRVVYEATVGAIPDGLQLDHLCGVKRCVNPDHLEPVTAQENTLRSTAPTAVNARRITCSQGHPLSGANLRIDKDGRRRCRTCGRERQRQYVERQRGLAD